MKKKGFTLIELLAVIVVLAIIALIATPIVMNIINSSKKGATERGAENYIKQVEVSIATKRLSESTSDLSSLDGTYTINSDGNLEGNGLTEPLVIETSGNRPNSGTIIVKDGEVQTASTMTIGDYSVTYSDGKCSATKNREEEISKVYNITYNLDYNITADDNNPTNMVAGDEVTLKFTDTLGCTNYLTVTGATYTWEYSDSGTFTLTLSQVTEDIVIKISKGRSCIGASSIECQ